MRINNNQINYFNNDVLIYGSLSALSGTTFTNTVFTTTSALSVINTGTGPALYVSQAPGNYDIASFYDRDGVEVLHVGNAPTPGAKGKIGINESNPGAELTVNGAISSNDGITAAGGNSNQWNSNWTTTNSNSANYILQNGNSFGSTMIIGTNDSQSISVRTNGAQRLLVTNTNHRFNGNVSVGTGADSSERLTVNGNISANGIITASGGNSNQWNAAYTQSTTYPLLTSINYTPYNLLGPLATNTTLFTVPAGRKFICKTFGLNIIEISAGTASASSSIKLVNVTRGNNGIANSLTPTLTLDNTYLLGNTNNIAASAGDVVALRMTGSAITGVTVLSASIFIEGYLI